MEPSGTRLRLKQTAMGLLIGGFIAVSIALPLMATKYPERQGAFEAQILSSASGMGMAGKPILRARVEDETGRTFWIQLPATHSSAAGTPLMVDVWCETETYGNCTARFVSSRP